MNASRRFADALTGLALVVALTGAALWLWRPASRVDALLPIVTPAPPTLARGAAIVRDSRLAARVAEGNVFAASRQPPRVRWTAPDAGFASADAMLPTATLPSGLAPDPTVPDEPAPNDAMPAEESIGAARRAAQRARDARVPALFGTVAGADGVRALLRLDPRSSGAQLYAVGAEAGGWRVTRVETDRVVLVGRGGRTTTLRLPRAVAPPATLPP